MAGFRSMFSAYSVVARKKKNPMCCKCEELMKVLSLILPELGADMQLFKAVIPSFLLVYTGIISGFRGP